jgi:tetratricopeptide (TPR) repeat protein
MLGLDRQTVAFRHELARQAVEDALSAVRRQYLHGDIVRVLVERDLEQTPLARLVHHAVQAEKSALVVRFAPDAARHASTQGAHREAAAYYQTALRCADQMPMAQQADLLDGLADEYHLTGRVQVALAPCEAALTLWRAQDQAERVGRTLRRLSRLSRFLGRNAEAERHGLAAVAALESVSQTHELAMAYANLAHVATRIGDSAATLLWAGRAITPAERLGDPETVCYALNSVGATEIDNRNEEQGQNKRERSLALALALAHGYEEHAARAYANLVLLRVLRRAYSEAERYLQDGIVYCDERALDPWGLFLRCVRARPSGSRGVDCGRGRRHRHLVRALGGGHQSHSRAPDPRPAAGTAWRLQRRSAA